MPLSLPGLRDPPYMTHSSWPFVVRNILMKVLGLWKVCSRQVVKELKVSGGQSNHWATSQQSVTQLSTLAATTITKGKRCGLFFAFCK